MVTTNNLQLTLLEQAQAQKEITINEGLTLIDSIQNRGVIDKDLSTPPGTPNSGDLYIVGASATGDWAGNEGKIAWYDGQIWRFITPQEGMTIWVNDENGLYAFDGTNWIFAGSTIQNAALIGINTTADATNKLAVASNAVLFNHNGNGTQIKLNKNATGDTASFLFQQGFTGKAEFGMIGDDDFTFKAGTGFATSFVIDGTTNAGNVSFKEDVEILGLFGGGAPTELTIASGAVTVTKTNHTVDTESDAATDDLDAINGGSDGDHLFLSIAATGRTVVFKDDTGNLKLAGDFSADHVTDMLHLQRRAGEWYEVSRSNNS